ncbi:DMT family transporter [Pseudoroseicyclus sp. CXY001]|uniref:DMT family transporter n=1 Tax=Pseudoroseicyclus sp. CXY001 TaxID=3242492 RepID=UPI0035711E24
MAVRWMASGGGAGAMVLGGMALIGLIDNFVALIAPTAGLWQFQAVRAGMALVVLVPLMAWRRVWPVAPGAVALRSVLATGGMLLYFGCLGTLPVALVAAGLFTAPIWLVLIDWGLRGARPGAGRALAVGLGFAGVVVMLDPFGSGGGWATGLAVLAGLLYGAGNLVTRLRCSQESPLSLLFGYYLLLGAVGALGCLALALWGPEVPEGAAGWALRAWGRAGATFTAVSLAQALGSLLAVGLLIRAYQLGEPARMAVMENSLLIFAALWGWWLWGDTLNPRELGGMGLILVGAVLAR